jgi:hypothetical protein
MSSTFRGRAALLACVPVVLLSACDPIYQVGARQALIGTRAMAPRKAPPPADSAAVLLDVAAAADCLEAALRASPALGDFSRWRLGSDQRWRRAGMTFSVTDPASGKPLYMSLRVETGPEQTPVLQILATWIGTARTVPLNEQRWMAATATALLEEVRARCVPASRAPIECVAEGIGGRAACTAGA